MAVNPSEQFAAPLDLGPGHLRVASINGHLVAATSATFTTSNNFNFTEYAIKSIASEEQKVLHSRGTTASAFSMSGEITQEGAGIVNFLDSSSRGNTFAVLSSQGVETVSLYSCLMESFSLAGAPNGAVTFSASGQSPLLVSAGNALSAGTLHSIPSWSSGANLVESWSISHNVSLSPVYRNNQNTLPDYFRPGTSEHQFQITTVKQLQEHDTISVGVSNVFMITGMVTSRVINFAGRQDVKTFSANITNVSITNQTLTEGMSVLDRTDPEAWPDGI